MYIYWNIEEGLEGDGLAGEEANKVEAQEVPAKAELQRNLAARVMGTFPQNAPTDPVADDDNISIPSSFVSIPSNLLHMMVSHHHLPISSLIAMCQGMSMMM